MNHMDPGVITAVILAAWFGGILVGIWVKQSQIKKFRDMSVEELLNQRTTINQELVRRQETISKASG